MTLVLASSLFRILYLLPEGFLYGDFVEMASTDPS